MNIIVTKPLPNGYDTDMTTAADTITIRFRGVRGSHPVPGADTLRYGGNTTCQEIRAGGRLLVFDAGTGIINLGRDLVRGGTPDALALFFSHYHHDHIDGLLYFKPAYRPDARVHIFGPADSEGNTIVQVMERVSCPAAHPVQFKGMGMQCTTTILNDGDAVVWKPEEDAPALLPKGKRPGKDDVVVNVMKNKLHPLTGVLNFRVEYKGKSYVYATDIEGDEAAGDPALAAFAQNADVLAHDGQYTAEDYVANRKGWGHSTIDMAIKTAGMAGAKQLVIIHHDPASTDAQLASMEKEAKKSFPKTFFAKEDQVLTL